MSPHLAEAASDIFLIMPNPGKGDRAPITTRVPVEHKAEYRREAARLGLDLSDYLALRLAELHSLEQPWWIRPVNDQEVLPQTV